MSFNVIMERMREIESPSQPWQGRILTTKLHPHMEGPTGFEPVIRVLQTHALPLGYRATKMTPTRFELVLPP